MKEAFAKRHAQDTNHNEIFYPIMEENSIRIDNDEQPPKEHNIRKIKFLEYPEATSVNERINRLLYGIETDVGAEYDYYGYEIRRYMVHVGNIKIYEDPEYLLEEYRNTRKAKVIAQFWRKYLESEIEKIEDIIKKKKNTSFSNRTIFIRNRSKVLSFLVSLNSWIDANEKILEKIGERPEIYSVKYPEIFIHNNTDRTDLYNLLSVRATKLKAIRKYTPFASMIY